jgi:hypothetical protein
MNDVEVNIRPNPPACSIVTATACSTVAPPDDLKRAAIRAPAPARICWTYPRRLTCPGHGTVAGSNRGGALDGRQAGASSSGSRSPASLLRGNHRQPTTKLAPAAHSDVHTVVPYDRVATPRSNTLRISSTSGSSGRVIG